MKQKRRSRLVIGLAFILILAFCLALPVAAGAPIGEDGEVTPGEGIPVYEGSGPADDVIVVCSDELGVSYNTETAYSLTVYVDDGPVAYSSWQLSFEVPAFISVEGLSCPDNTSSTPFVYRVDGQVVSVTFSSTVERCGGVLFELWFKLNEDAEPDSSGYLSPCVAPIFTNRASETLPVSFDFSEIFVRSGLPAKGDFNLDGEVTLADVIEMQRAIVGLRGFNGDDGFYAADVNRDNEVNIIDVQYVQMYLIGEINSLEDLSSEVVAIRISVRILDPDGKQIGQYDLTFPDPVEGDTYKAALDSVFYSEEVQARFPKMVYDDAYTASGADPFDNETVVSHDDVIFIPLAPKGEEYSEDEVQARVVFYGRVPIVQNGDREAVCAALDGLEVIVDKYVERENYEFFVERKFVILTARNVGDISALDLSKLDDYVEIPVEVNGVTGSVSAWIVPDLSDAEIVATGVKLNSYYTTYNGRTELVVEPYYFEMYDNGIIRTCEFDDKDDDFPQYSFMEYTQVIENDVAVFGVATEGMIAYYVISETEFYEEEYPLVVDYLPAEGEETVSYTLSIGEGYTIRLDVFGEGRYAMLYQCEPGDEEMTFEGTVAVELNAEENTLSFMDSTYVIGEDNMLSIGLPEEEPVEIVDYYGEAFLLYEGGVGYFTMDGEVVMQAEWWYEYDEDDNIIALIISIMGYENEFYRWSDGNWYDEEEPDFSNATVRNLTLDGEAVTLYTWAGEYYCWIRFGADEKPIQGSYNADANVIRYYGGMGDGTTLLIVGNELIPAEEYQVQIGRDFRQIYVGGTYASGNFGRLTDYSTILMTCSVDQDGGWTFYDAAGGVVMTCVADPEGENLLIAQGDFEEEHGEEDPGEKITVYLHVMENGRMVEKNGDSAVYGASLWDSYGSLIGSTRVGRDGSVLVCTGIYWDGGQTDPLTPDDCVNGNCSLYVFYETSQGE